ncbi:uncharacterized protein TNCV_3437451 [Trichonephila clavipes]|nr:uncharacterized protein TNCV_3437451 [Trichonephila clavipes]
MAWSQTDFECPLVKKISILLVCAANIRLLKLQDADHERDADKLKSKLAQYAIYPANKWAKKDVACVGMNRIFELSLQNICVHYAAER